MFQMCLNYLENIVSTEKGRLILLGGIQINVPRPMSDYFQPMHFQISEEGKPVKGKLHVFERDASEINASARARAGGAGGTGGAGAPPEPSNVKRVSAFRPRQP